MLKPGDIAVLFHNQYCIPHFIPLEISPPHGAEIHLNMWGYYLDEFNPYVDNLTAEEVVKALFDVLQWDYNKDPWPGHPDPGDLLAQIIVNRKK